ncbi:MAG: hypothetical protein KDA22_01925 [Phycisphaerales bacterium]|nr:hypothetical protein [Phycisphaerales bacterium]
MDMIRPATCVRRTAAVVAIAMAGLAMALVGSPSAFATGNDKPPPNWLVQVGHVALQDLNAGDLKRIASLETELAALGPADPKREPLTKKLAREKETAENRRGFVVYGWRADADAKGRPTDGSRTVSAILLPGDAGNRRTLSEFKPGDFIVVQATGSKRILSVSGRSFVEARRASRTTFGDDWGAAKAFAELPEKPAPPEGGVTASVRFRSVKERDSGEGYRYTLSVEAASPPATAQTLVAWCAVRYRTDRGEVIGPVLDEVSIERGKEGGFARAYGFDVTAWSGTKLDPTAATVEVIATIWK